MFIEVSTNLVFLFTPGAYPSNSFKPMSRARRGFFQAFGATSNRSTLCREKSTTMPAYTIPAHELRAHVDPRDGTMWKCAPIDQSEIDAALASGITEDRQWNDLVNTLGYEESRSFHINRIATFVRNSPPQEEVIVVILENHINPVRAYLHDGNHRLAATYVRGDTHVVAIIAASVPESIHDVFPGAVLTEMPTSRLGDRPSRG